MPEEQDIQTVAVLLREKIEREGLSHEHAIQALRDQLSAIPQFFEAIDIAAERRLKEVQRIEMLQIPAIPRRRHDPWYGGPTQNGFWDSYITYLTEGKDDFSDSAVKSIDETSTKIVSLLTRPGAPTFSTRSLVLGYVQSGKTANMTAVIAKAADAGYRFIIVLAGLTDALRRQTQERLEEDLIAHSPERWDRLTTVDEEFYSSPNIGFAPPQEQNRCIAIVKKNSYVLKRILDKLENTHGSTLNNMPFLIIDDECDQASVNAARYAEEMTAINGRIRRMLNSLPKAAYIGYTATPFANVLIDPSIDPQRPDDLYPRDFIVSLPKPEGYFGTEELFGKTLTEANDDEDADDGLDMIRSVPFSEVRSLRPSGHRDREAFNLDVTESLESAIRYYLMVCAARAARGDAHMDCCMLVHTSVYTSCHFNAQGAIRARLRELAQQVRSGNTQLAAELRTLWSYETSRINSGQFDLTPVSYDQLEPHLEDVLDSCQVKVENGISDERLDFSGDGPHRYIVVGGSVLARGLTIKGLAVSFFLRTSSQYDSLMQMGRWFGYRKNYEDMPRVWMTDDMRDAFQDLATVEAEIRQDIALYERDETTPMDFAVRIRQIPGMAITARNKMLAGRECNISYSGEHIQTTRFYHKNAEWLGDNWENAATLISSIVAEGGAIEEVDGGRVIRDVRLPHVRRFLQQYQTHETHRKVDVDKLLEYIETQSRHPEAAISSWNIGIVEPASNRESQDEIAELGKVRTVRRAMSYETEDGAADIKALMSKQDVLLDTDLSGIEGNWEHFKEQRQRELGIRPLLLLYAIDAESEPRNPTTRRDGSLSRVALNAVSDVLAIAIVFPTSPIDTPVYVQVDLPDVEYEEPELPDTFDDSAENAESA